MTPLALFVLACATVYVGSVQVAFSALMRLPLRLNAERAERQGRAAGLGHYLDDPIRLFLPARLLQAVNLVLMTMLVTVRVGTDRPGVLGAAVAALLVVTVVCAHLVPLLLARRDPEATLDLLLPAFHRLVRLLTPLTRPLLRLLNGTRRDRDDDAAAPAPAALGEGRAPAEPRTEAAAEEERELLQSVVEFGDTLVREVMTPRPDIVAVKASVTLEDLRGVFAEQQYSRLPVYRDSLDDIQGFVFVKDLVGLSAARPDELVVERLLRPATVVPETKRVAELLKEFQRDQVQIAVVHDEYGGTAGLVSLEDLLEEIVGEIRDEYDVESEPIIDEGDGSFVFSGTVGVDDAASRLAIDIERHGFETVGGYVLSRLGRVPRVGERLAIDDLTVEILEAERRRVHRVRIRRPSAAPTSAG